MAFLKSQRKRAMRVRTSEKMAKRIIGHILIEKIVMGVGSQSEPTPCKTFFKNAERSANFEGEKGRFSFS